MVPLSYKCPLQCGTSLHTEDEISQHQKTCSNRRISCCQGTASCQKEIKQWLDANENKLTLCRHNSSAVYGAIREDNIDLIQDFLVKLKHQLLSVFSNETSLGDSLLTFAASLGRTAIVKAILDKMDDIVHDNNSSIALSDLTDHETSRGKIALVEAVKNNHTASVTLLLSAGANPSRPSRTHNKSALDWARVLRNESLVDTISKHIELEQHVFDLFKAISIADAPTIHALIDGGVPYKRNQDSTFHETRETMLQKVELAKQSVVELSAAVQEELTARDDLKNAMRIRLQQIESMQLRQQVIVSTRQSRITQALAKVRLALTPNSTLHATNMVDPSLEMCLIAKSLCTLFRISIINGDETHNNNNSGYWQKLKGLLKDKASFYHRLRHYHFDPVQVDLAANVRLEGVAGTCSEWVQYTLGDITSDVGGDGYEPRENVLGSVLVTSISYWLGTIFNSSTGHEEERELIMQESSERDVFERNKIDLEVLVSRCAILRRELDDVNSSIDTNYRFIADIERKMKISRVMNFVTSDGHTALSWASASGNNDVTKLLLKNGARTAIGDDCIGWSASIIQVSFRHYIWKSAFKRKSLVATRSSRERAYELKTRDLTVSLRRTSLSRLVKRRVASIRLPLAEALINGHFDLIHIIGAKSDISLFQAINVSSLFKRPSGMIPRHLPKECLSEDNTLTSSIMPCLRLQHEQDVDSCAFVSSYKSVVDLTGEHLRRRKQALDAKIAARQQTLYNRHRRANSSELKAAILRGDFTAMVQASEAGHLSLDYEDYDSGITPLLCAAARDDSARHHQLYQNNQAVSAVAYLLDRISPSRPNVNLENSKGHTALTFASVNGRLDAIKDLLSRGAEINRQTVMTGQTALMYACLVGNLDVVHLLVELGADLHLRDHSNFTANDFATRGSHFAIVDFISDKN